jgi:hypothetical protein
MAPEMSKSPETTAREHRLAAKLRENLRRRKEQARARASEPGQGDAVEADDSPDGQAPLKRTTDSVSTS